MLGVILSMFGAGTASAYFIEATAYCHATGQVDAPCPVGSAVTITANAQGGTGFETFDFDSDTLRNGNAPEVFNAREATFTYSLPGNKNVGIRATDGSNSYGGYSLDITDPDGKPDPALEPAYTADPGIWEVFKGKNNLSNKSSSCTISRTLFFQSYRDYVYEGRVEARYRFRSPAPNSTRKRTAKGRLALVKRGPVAAPASYEPQVKRLYWRFDRNSPRIRRLIKRRATVTLLSKQQVTINGQLVTNEASRIRLNLKECTLR